MIQSINPTFANNPQRKKYPVTNQIRNYALRSKNQDDVFVSSKNLSSKKTHDTLYGDVNLIKDVTKSFFNIDKSNPEAVEIAQRLKDPDCALDLFVKAKKEIDKANVDNDPIVNFYSNQLALSIDNLSKLSNKNSNISFTSTENIKNMFQRLKVGCDKEFSEYFPVDEFNMDELTFNTKLFDIFMDEKKKFLLVESLNSELSKVGMSDELNIYIKEDKSRQIGKLAGGVLGSSPLGPVMATGKAIYNYNNKNKDDFDKSVDIMRSMLDMVDLLVTGGAVTAVAKFNADVAAANSLNPEMFSKTAIWIGNGLIALSCIAVRSILKEAREREERETIEALKYVKATHICMQEGFLDSRKVGNIVKKLGNK